MKVWLSKNIYDNDKDSKLIHLHTLEPFIEDCHGFLAFFTNKGYSTQICYKFWLKTTGIKIDGGEVYELDISPGKLIKVIDEWTYLE